MKLSTMEIERLVRGSTILGTGGGGRYDEAMRLTTDIPPLELLNVEEVPPDKVVITAYGAGGLTKPAVSPPTVRAAVAELQDRVGQVAGIVPVEIGPYSLAAAFQVAAMMGLPVIDGDFVGYRSVPEIFIELMTLAGRNRCPLVVANEEGDRLTLISTASDESLETIVRGFADQSVSNTIVVGYPISGADLSGAIATGSVSYCLEVSGRLQTDFELIGAGIVVSDDKAERDGFTWGTIEIDSESDGRLSVDFKNEYLILRRHADVIVTCPDLICLVDGDSGIGLNNGEGNRGKKVDVLVRPAIPAWRTDAGLELFSPRRLGLAFDQVLWEPGLPHWQ